MEDEFGDDSGLVAVASSLDRAAAPPVTANASSKVQQPKPQALPSRAGPSSIIVSTRQKGNPSLNYIRNVPWEYGDIPADYVLGATTCALFLSLKYHRLHPEYVYARIKSLGHKYNLRVLLTMVDIQNHEESLKELSKTSLVNNLTLILCWSAQEAGRYLELYKSYEHASPTSIRAHQATTYSEKLVEFVTVPRSVNKTDAFSLVSAFGSVRAAVNARPEEIGEITGWGEKKVQRWCGTVREPFRVRKAAKRRAGLSRGESSMDDIGRADDTSNGVEQRRAPSNDPHVNSDDGSIIRNDSITLGRNDTPATTAAAQGRNRIAVEIAAPWVPDADVEAALFAVAETGDEEITAARDNTAPQSASAGKTSDALSDGVAAALAKLRQQ